MIRSRTVKNMFEYNTLFSFAYTPAKPKRKMTAAQRNMPNMFPVFSTTKPIGARNHIRKIHAAAVRIIRIHMASGFLSGSQSVSQLIGAGRPSAGAVDSFKLFDCFIYLHAFDQSSDGFKTEGIVLAAV